MTDPKTPENPFLQDDLAEPAPEAAPEAFVDPVTALQTENAELKDKILRTLAEMENLRRRTARDVHDGRTYAVTSFARDMLTVADNLARALDSAPKDAGAESPLKALIDGVELTARDLLKALERHGVKKLEPKGQKFDPNFHQAIFEAPSDTIPAGMVSEVVQTGYAIGERVLRPALVGVSKGAAKTNGAGES